MIAGLPLSFSSPAPPLSALPAAQGPQISRCRSGWSGFGPGKNSHPDQFYCLYIHKLNTIGPSGPGKNHLSHIRTRAHAVILIFTLSLIFLFIKKNPDYPDQIINSST